LEGAALFVLSKLPQSSRLSKKLLSLKTKKTLNKVSQGGAFSNSAQNN
jgi:hypothetical protein